MCDFDGEMGLCGGVEDEPDGREATGVNFPNYTVLVRGSEGGAGWKVEGVVRVLRGFRRCGGW